MTDLIRSSALLPIGLSDLLPPLAAHESALVERLMQHFARHGYDRVKPPMVEFEDNLLSGPGAGMATQSFRIADPNGQHMMAVRADMTLQIARIATTRLVRMPRPLRLSYTGEVLRVRGTQLRPERQFRQVGCELFGAASPRADAEIIVMAASSLTAIGVTGLSVDLAMPRLLDHIMDDAVAGMEDRGTLVEAVDRRDQTTLRANGSAVARVLSDLVGAIGPAQDAIARLTTMTLPPAARAEVDHLISVVSHVSAAVPTLMITVDPVERRGFEYKAGLSFTLFAKGVRGELGRGGRYRAGHTGETAVGATVFTDSLLRAVPGKGDQPRVLLPIDTSATEADGLRGDGWITVAQLDAADDEDAVARQMGCSHRLVDGVPVAVAAVGDVAI